MSSLPPSSTPPAGDDSTPESLPPQEAAATDAPESTPVAAADTDSAPESAPAAAGPAPEDCGPQLKQLYPALFSNPPKPLKLRIQADIQARSPGLFTKPQLSAFLRRYTGSHGYINALVKATHRFDLDGNPGDALSDEHRQAAVDELARRRTVTQARRALEDEQRFNRSVLLRDFEVTKLDKAGFATLKGVPEGELDGLLERARKEAAEPPPAARPDRRGPPPNRGPRPDREGQGQRGPRPPRPAGEARTDGAAPATDGSGPAPQGARPDAPRGPRPEGARPPRSDANRGPQGPRPEGDRGPRGPRPEGQRGPRPDGQRGPRADGLQGARPDAPRSPRNDRPRDDRPRGPRPDDARNARPNVSSSPAVPTAMELAFSALRGGKPTK